ncbi:malate/Llactate dehydrogenase [Acanthamoeba castellanii str. Neff]|uniref:Malate/Llactate dehydrogenase n=1 Tax=Acanthamoeba castellanii (strain ATCC 30010 / Neff) TaxID=1257118 RepID=L8GX63_ACACF|nr:malate/Llactate dehydrogenase [Acanthamoeba castellanii str. Neff]ELR16661.1 malate/Llactate dehydrogenase [Acanthamoeba castellanii str. Neff]
MEEEQRVDGVQLELFARAVLEKAGCEVPSAEAVAWSLTEGSLRGVDSHGIRLLPHYVENLVHGGINGKPNMTWSSTYPAFVVLDADHAFGAAAGFKAIDIGIERAQQYGVAAVGVINSTHPGMMASYVLRAAAQGYLAFAFTNTGPKILSHNGKQPYFGTNPIAFACPRLEKEPFCLDMATSMIPWNKVEAARKTGKQLPEGTVADEEGNPTTDPHVASSLLAAGSYKGFGLAAMVELLCTALLGMAFGHHTVQMYGPTSDMSEKRRLGQFYLVARCDACVSLPQFLQAVQQMTNEVRSEPPKESAVMLPNDPEIKVEVVRRQHGIPLDEVVLGELVALGRRFSVPFPPLLSSSSSTAKL